MFYFIVVLMFYFMDYKPCLTVVTKKDKVIFALISAFPKL